VTSGRRYAIYFVPPTGCALYRFGSAMLGYDCWTGAEVAYPAGLPPNWPELAAAPRQYGFHATMKAPFRLPPGRDESTLMAALEEFTDRPRKVPVVALVVRSLGAFVAVVPRERNAVLDQLAADCVVWFDRFRAPLSAGERARRLRGLTSERQRANVDRWGYPYVHADFQFHMTLTGALPDEVRGDAESVLVKWFEREQIPDTLAIDRLALLVQENERSRFRVLKAREL
jgi:hypothetical protein